MRYILLFIAMVALLLYGVIVGALYVTPARAELGDSWTVALAGVVAGEVLCEGKLPEDIRRQVMLKSWAERSDTEATLRTIRTISATIVDRGRSDEEFRVQFCSVYEDLASGALR